MTSTQFLLVMCILFAAILACICSYRIGYEDGYLKKQEEIDDEESARLDGMYEAYRQEFRRMYSDRIFNRESDHEEQFDDGYLPQDPPEDFDQLEEDLYKESIAEDERMGIRRWFDGKCFHD